jgi:glyoxylase-like metal-dependent hydrolase (beta-lactamase superfamily II)
MPDHHRYGTDPLGPLDARSVPHAAGSSSLGGVSLVAQTGLQFDLRTAQGKLIASLMAALAEFDRDLLRERVRSGIAAARKRGVVFGRRPGQRLKADRYASKVLKAIADEGLAPRQIKYILLTHAHKDHAGSAAQLRNATGAKVVSHALDAEIIESGVHQRPMTPAPGILNRILFQLFVKDLLPVPRTTVDRHVGDGEVMDDLDGLQVIHTPGHCAGQVAFLWPREGGVLFVGDAAANTLGLRLSISYEDLALGKRMLAKLAALPFSVALFGHGRTIASGAAEKFARKWGTA